MKKHYDYYQNEEQKSALAKQSHKIQKKKQIKEMKQSKENSKAKLNSLNTEHFLFTSDSKADRNHVQNQLNKDKMLTRRQAKNLMNQCNPIIIDNEVADAKGLSIPSSTTNVPQTQQTSTTTMNQGSPVSIIQMSQQNSNDKKNNVNNYTYHKEEISQPALTASSSMGQVIKCGGILSLPNHEVEQLSADANLNHLLFDSLRKVESQSQKLLDNNVYVPPQQNLHSSVRMPKEVMELLPKIGHYVSSHSNQKAFVFSDAYIKNQQQFIAIQQQQSIKKYQSKTIQMQSPRQLQLSFLHSACNRGTRYAGVELMPMCNSVFFLAVHLYDRFQDHKLHFDNHCEANQSQANNEKENVLDSVTALLIASKMEEIYPPNILSLMKYSNTHFNLSQTANKKTHINQSLKNVPILLTKEDVIKNETRHLKHTLRFCIPSASVRWFVDLLSICLQSTNAVQAIQTTTTTALTGFQLVQYSFSECMLRFAWYLCELIQRAIISLQYTPSQVAVGIIKYVLFKEFGYASQQIQYVKYFDSKLKYILDHLQLNDNTQYVDANIKSAISKAMDEDNDAYSLMVWHKYYGRQIVEQTNVKDS